LIGTSSRRDLDTCRVHALDAESGTPLWNRVVDGSVQGGVSISDGRAYLGTTAGTCYALALDDGNVAWAWNNHDNLPITCEIVRDADLLHFGANWECYAVDLNGRLRWRSLCFTNGLSYFSGGHAAPLVIGDRVLHARPYNGEPQFHQLQSFSKATGDDRQLSDLEAPGWPTKRHASPVRYGNNALATINGIALFDPADISKVIWHLAQPEISATPAVGGDVAFASYHPEIRAHDLRDGGRVLWSKPQEHGLYHFGHAHSVTTRKGLSRGSFAAPLVAGDDLLVADTGGNLRCLRAGDGREVWRVSVPNPMIAAPTVSGRTCFCADYEGNVYAFGW
jgi:outer membrane protein assembly factor BamB